MRKQLSLFHYSVVVLLLLASCQKEPPPQPPLPGTFLPPLPPPPRPILPLPPFPPVPDSFSGKEYRFPDLVWIGSPWQVYVEVPSVIPFMNRGLIVSIDSSGTAIEAPFYTFEYPDGTFPYPENKGYVYDNNWFEHLFVFAIGSNSRQLVGTKASIKVKVL